MWNALRSDFQEFVSTVADDTSNVLSKIDTGLNDGGERGEGNDANNSNSDTADQNEKKNNAVAHAELKEIMTLLRDHPGTYTEDLADEDDNHQVEAFL